MSRHVPVEPVGGVFHVAGLIRSPEPVEREPSTLAIIAGACLALAALWIVCVVLFSF